MRHSLLSSLVGDPEICALFAPAAEIRAMLAVEAALARAQAHLGMISEEAGEGIAAACKTASLDEASIREGLARDGVPVPDFVRQLRAKIGPPHGGSVHLGATSQDIVDTALMLRLRDVVAVLRSRLDAVIGLLDGLCERDGTLALMAQTRMQAALPFTAGAKIVSWREPLVRAGARLDRLRDEALAIQLGGPIGDGSSFGQDFAALRADFAARLDLPDAPPWHSSRDRIMEIASAFALLSGSLGKLGQDIALMAQNEVGTVRISGGGGSSAMAHKQNPVGAEVLVALARFNAGMLGTLHQSMVHENERSGAAWTLEWIVLPQMAETTGASLRHARPLLEGLSFSAAMPGR